MFLRRITSIPFWVLLYLPWLALLGWLAAVSWFLTDDAFISFRYVRNLVEGHGLVFNVGERVEGYSNFLWVLELAAIWKVLGVAPEHSAPWLSVAYTAGTVGALLWWACRLPALPHRGLVGWLALGLVCSSATFAVWTSGGGLETRQFTFFIVLAVVFLSLYRGNRWGLLAASLSLAAAAYTRPEGPLIALCCFGWFLFQRLADSGRLQPDWRELRRLAWPGLAWLILPFVILVAGHFLFRYAYYGEWLPNTYYAKHVRPWYESGFRYLWAAALETGLYLLLPLAWVGLARRWRELRDGIYALVLLLIIAHLAYVMRIGGDHFEWRPLDFYWPLLALPAAAGIVHLGAGLAAWLRQFTFHPSVWLPGARTCALILFIPVIFYASAMQVVLLFEGARIDQYALAIHPELNEENAGWLLAAPGMSALSAISGDLRQSLIRQTVGMRFVEHREFANVRMERWQPYENMERGIIPADAVIADSLIGIPYYYLPEPAVIDKYGLTDATVARLEHTTPNAQRHMAHDRWAPPEYLAERGVNFVAYPAAATEQEALKWGKYAVPVGPDLWLPFDSDDHEWVSASFAGRGLVVNTRLSQTHPTDPAGNQLTHADGSVSVGEGFIGNFEAGLDGWTLKDDAFTNHASHESYSGQLSISGNIGPGFLTSYHPTEGDRSIGRALSPEFEARADQRLAFLIAGGRGRGVGVRLLADGEEVAVWRGENTEGFEPVIYSLADVAGRRLQLELFDIETGGWGHIMLDHVLLLSRQATGE